MSGTTTSRTAAVLGALGALVAALLVVVGSPGTAFAAACDTTFNVVTGNWTTGGNWTSGAPGPGSVACIPNGRVASLTGGSPVHVKELQIDNNGGGVALSGAAALFVDGAGPSVWGTNSQVTVNGSTLGGTGRIDTHGFIDFDNGAVLSSIAAAPGTSYGGPSGTLNIAGAGTPEGAGTVTIQDGAVAMRASYAVGIFGDMIVQNDGFVTADWGTNTSVVAGGTLELNGAGGYYQGSQVAGKTIGSLINNGLIDKTGGGTTSIVDAAYSEGASGAIHVDCCATLAFAGGQVVSGKVQPSMSLGTGACGTGVTSVCGGSVDPAVDPSNAVLQLSGNGGNASNVQVQELAQPPATTDSRAIGNDVFAHADSLVQDKTQPATITLRFSQADVMSTPLNEVQVAHISDTGQMTQTPDCAGANIPAGSNYCIVRPVTRTAQNTFVTVKTIETSRWRLRRTAPNESFDQTPPSVPQSAAATLTGGGSSVHLVWAAPANDGGAAVSSYRVLFDGKQVATPTGLSADIANPGVGAHTLEVQAVNIVGGSAKATTAVTIKAMSKPRNAVVIKGAKGGKRTAGVKWKAPVSVGGFALKSYQVVVTNKAGKVVAKKTVAASKLRLVLTFKTTGKVRFKVRAKNLDKYGPFSKPTDLVQPR